MESLSLRDCAKWFCADPVKCVNTTYDTSSEMIARATAAIKLTWTWHGILQKRLALRDALTFVFLTPIGCHVIIRAVLQNPVITRRLQCTKIYL